MKNTYVTPKLTMVQAEATDLIRTSLNRSDSRGDCDEHEIIF